MAVTDFPFDYALGKIQGVDGATDNVLQFDYLPSGRFCLQISASFLLFDDVSEYQGTGSTARCNLCAIVRPMNVVQWADRWLIEFRIAIRPLEEVGLKSQEKERYSENCKCLTPVKWHNLSILNPPTANNIPLGSNSTVVMLWSSIELAKINDPWLSHTLYRQSSPPDAKYWFSFDQSKQRTLPSCARHCNDEKYTFNFVYLHRIVTTAKTFINLLFAASGLIAMNEPVQ